MTIPAASVVVAFVVGGLETLNLVGGQFGLSFFADLGGRELKRRRKSYGVAIHENDVMLPKCSSSSKTLESCRFLR